MFPLGFIADINSRRSANPREEKKKRREEEEEQKRKTDLVGETALTYVSAVLPELMFCVFHADTRKEQLNVLSQ